MVTLVVYFIVLVNVAKGLRQVQPTHLELLRSYAATPSQVLRKARIPNAVPYLFTALKIAAPPSVITAFVAEYFGGSQNGLGTRITSNLTARTPRPLGVRARCLPARADVLPGLHRCGEHHHTQTGRQPRGRTHDMSRSRRIGGSPARRRAPSSPPRAATTTTTSGVDTDAAVHDDRHRRGTDDAGIDRPPGRRAGWHRCTGDDRRAPRARVGGECDTPTPVTLQLQWFTQAQFGGYFAAIDQGFYEDQCLDVEILEGGVDIVPQHAARRRRRRLRHRLGAQGAADREPGADIVNIAQIFQRSGTLQVSFKDAGITSPDDFAGKNDRQLGLRQRVRDLRRTRARPVSIPPPTSRSCSSSSTWSVCSSGDIDAAEAMTYNEYAQVLEAVNPDTGELYTPEDFNVVSYEEVGVGMLQDAIWADAERLASRRRLPRHRHAVRRRVDPGLGLLP